MSLSVNATSRRNWPCELRPDTGDIEDGNNPSDLPSYGARTSQPRLTFANATLNYYDSSTSTMIHPSYSLT